MPGKIISRIKGGVGNQLFCYAAARRLALANGAELVIDDVSGFAHDHLYRRRSLLGHFQIPVRIASARERGEPAARLRRAVAKRWARLQPFDERPYIEQEGIDFDPRLLQRRVQGTVWLDGLWQSEGYFADVAPTIRDDLRIVPPRDEANLTMSRSIAAQNAVALHVRWFDRPGATAAHNMTVDYYAAAMQWIEERVPNPHYFLFSDDAIAARNLLDIQPERMTPVSFNDGETGAIADLWLMTQCRHFIIANSTFSWWGAWLGERPGSLVACPAREIGAGHVTAWNFAGQLPTRWTKC